MNKVAAVVMCLALWRSGSTAYAEELILDAFDMTLGGVFNIESAIGTSETDGGEILYRYEPSKPFSTLDSYFVLVTPKSSKIAEIWATGSFKENSQCSNELKTISIILMKKYPNAKERDVISMDESFILETGDTYVAVRCPISFGSDAILYVQYASTPMRDLAEQERAEQRIEADQGSDSF